MNDRKKRKDLLCLSLILLLFVAAAWFLGKPAVAIARKPEIFRQWIDGLGILGELAYMGMVILQVVVAVIPGEPFEICGGYAFGILKGTALYLVAAMLGGMLVFFFVRRYGMRFVRVFFSEKQLDRVKFLQTSTKRDILLFLLFFIPGTPKDILCYVAGLTDIKWHRWMLICSLGRIPSVIPSTISGDALGEKNCTLTILIVVVTLVVSGIGLLIYRMICNRHEKTE